MDPERWKQIDRYVKDQLGHSSIKVTVDIYGHLVPGANRQEMNRLPTLKRQEPVKMSIGD